MKKIETLTIERPKTLILGLDTPYNTTADIDSYFNEFISLVKSNNIEYDIAHFIKLRSIDGAYFLTKGKLQELAKICKENDIEEIIVSEPLSPQQERNLGEYLKCKVFDRTQLILEIFEKGAQSAEGKLQVELAFFQYKKSRLSGLGISLSQQAGRIGTRGPGETAKEKELQYIKSRENAIRQALIQLRKQRETQRKKRLTSKIPLICLVGYTNAGKSTILNMLTKSDVLAKDKLFATLDTTTRELFINGKKKALLSDTVGFIQLIPHKLIEAFKSTLDELHYADLLLVVTDASDANWKSHISVVLEVLDDIKVNKPILFVFNKIDKVEGLKEFEEMAKTFQPNVMVNALSKNGLDPLISFLENWYPENK